MNGRKMGGHDPVGRAHPFCRKNFQRLVKSNREKAEKYRKKNMPNLSDFHDWMADEFEKEINEREALDKDGGRIGGLDDKGDV